jgi:hypothetical protein
MYFAQNAKENAPDGKSDPGRSLECGSDQPPDCVSFGLMVTVILPSV